MKIIILILLAASYILAFSINLLSSIKHPDTTMNITQLYVSAFYLLILTALIIVSSRITKGTKIVRLFVISGIFSGILIYIITTFEHIMMEYFILDILASIQYPIYPIFVTPLFGFNYLFDLKYGEFSLLVSLVYLVLWYLGYRTKKR